MKRLRPIVLTIAFLLSFLSYSQKTEQEATQMEQVMEYHDVVMSKMPDLVKLIGKLQAKVDSTKIGQKHQAAIDNLKESNKSMMSWMEGFGKRFDAEEMMKGKELTTEKLKWLSEEEKKVKALQKEINSSMKKAEKLLKKQ